MSDTQRLQKLDEGLWLAEGPVVDFYSFPYPTRSIIARLPQNRLWVWSPIELDAELKEAVDTLGSVAFLVSPNKIHHLGLDDWRNAYPNAELWGPPSVIRKRADLRFAGELGDEPPGAWAETIDQAWFRASLLLDEVVFFHRPSATAIFADLSENFSDSYLNAHWSRFKRAIARLWRIKEPYGYAPLELRLATFRRTQARATVQRILDWRPERVIMAHGRWVENDGEAYIRKAFGWLI